MYHAVFLLCFPPGLRCSIRKAGFTLAETIVASGIALLVLGILVSSFVYMGRSLLRHSSQSEAQRNVLMLMNKMREELHHACPESLYSPDPTWFSFASNGQPDAPLTWDDNGQVYWTHWVVYYYQREGGRIYEQDLPITPPAVDLVPLQMQAFTPSSTDRLIASGITSLTCVRPVSGGIVLDVRSVVQDGHSEMLTSINPANCNPAAYPTASSSP